MKVAFIRYTNTKPFYYGWPEDEFEGVSGSPKEIATWARDGQLLAGPLPVVETWAMENQFEPLGNFGIAVKQSSNSVFLLSKKPLSFLNDVKIGVTPESATSVALLRVLIEKRYNHEVLIRTGFASDDEARLYIGDEALATWDHTADPKFGVRTDLAAEWWDWKKSPFVFARWVVGKNVIETEKERLKTLLGTSLDKGLAAIGEICQEQEKALGIPAHKIRMYLNGFTYRLGPVEEASLKEFRRLVGQLERQKELALLH